MEFKKFLALIDKSVPEEFEVHLVLDNYGTHKTAMIHNWLLRRPRYHLHFTPTSASWINQVERWFAEITRQRIRRGTFRSTRGAGSGDPRVFGSLQRRPQTIYLGQERRRDLGITEVLL